MLFLLLSLFSQRTQAEPPACNICDIQNKSMEILSDYNIGNNNPTVGVYIKSKRTDELPDSYPSTFLILTYTDTTSQNPHNYFTQTIQSYVSEKDLTCDYSNNFLFVLDEEEYTKIKQELNVETSEIYFGYYESVAALNNLKSTLGFLCYDCVDKISYDHLDFVVQNTCRSHNETNY